MGNFSECVDCGRPRNDRLPGCPHCGDRSAYTEVEPEEVNKCGATRQNEGKTPFQYISPIVLSLKGQINAYANQKYGDARNWEKGLDWLSVYDSMMRHLMMWRMGEDLDEESGLAHMLHAGWACDTLVHYMYTNTGNDDREGYRDQLSLELKLTDAFKKQAMVGEILEASCSPERGGYTQYRVMFPKKINKIYMFEEELTKGVDIYHDSFNRTVVVVELDVAIPINNPKPIFTAEAI